jgi:hypothetical protein
LHIFGGYALGEISFDGVDTLVEKFSKAANIPLGSLWVGKINNSHACLPEIPLEYISVLALQEVAFAGCHFENR